MTKAEQQDRRIFLLVTGATALACAGRATRAQAARPIAVIFICGRGHVTSLVAAPRIGSSAQRRGVGVRALSRGVAPDCNTPEGTRAGAADDGLAIGDMPSRSRSCEAGQTS